MSKKVCWLYLTFSILLEVAGTCIMKISQPSCPVGGILIMYTCLGISYFTLSKALLRLPIGVAYAFWEGLGLLGILFVSVLFLNEILTARHYVAILLIVGGSLLIHHGTEN